MQSEFLDLDIPTLKRAAQIYLDHAYPDGAVPDSVRRRLDWPEGLSVQDIVSRPPFETVVKPGGPTAHCLRLGNAHYKHMKLQIQRWPSKAGYLLSVNAHDQITAADPEAPGMAEFREIQAANQVLKQSIEQAWDAAGLPIFLRYLQDYIDGSQGGAAAV